MFQNVPERLAAAIRNIPAEKRVWPMRYVLPAGMVIVEYLKLMPTGPEADRFFDFKPHSDGSVSYDHTVRIMMVAEIPFLLRNQPGFAEFCRRFQGRTLRSTYYELYEASLFLRGGFALHARPEIGIKGEDFDFRAVRPSDTINCEVTALAAPVFSLKTVRNALDTKRRQLPSDAPAIIICVYPESWFTIGPDAVRSGLMQVASDFFSSTMRINAVAFASEQHWDAPKKGTLGALFVTHLPLANVSPRHPISSLDFFMNVSNDSPRNFVERNNLPEEISVRLHSEFFLWIVGGDRAPEGESRITVPVPSGRRLPDIVAIGSLLR
jgi:hypothetical protein